MKYRGSIGFEGARFKRSCYGSQAGFNSVARFLLSNDVSSTHFLTMAPTILIIGATSNTGRSVVETLLKLSKRSNTLSGHRLLALTRSSNSPAAQQIAKLPSVKVAEQKWVEITADWLS